MAAACRGIIFICAVGSRVVVVCVEAELGLNGGRVDPILVQAFPNFLGKTHISCRPLAFEVEVHLDVQRRDELRVGELPDVQVMTGDDAF